MSTKFIFTLLTLGGILQGCLHTTKATLCESDHVEMIGSDTCILFNNRNELSSLEPRLQQKISESLNTIRSYLKVPDLLIIVDTDPYNVIPEIGIGGFNPDEYTVRLSINPDFKYLYQAIDTSMPSILAHEIHHAMRRRSVGYGSTLGEAIITEGLADHFSIEVFQTSPPVWSTYIQEPELSQLMKVAKENWLQKDYNHGKWFVGSSMEIPRWTGYSLGFKIVADYLNQHMGLSPSQLHSQPASSFLTAE